MNNKNPIEIDDKILKWADKKHITIPNSSESKNNICEKVIKFRDNELFNIYNKTNIDFKFRQELIYDLKKIRTELIDENKWNSSTEKRDLEVFLNGFIKPILKGILEFSKITTIPAKVLIDLYKGYEDIDTIINEGVKKVVIDKIIEILKSELDPVKKLLKIIYDAISDITKIDEDFKQYRKTLSENILTLENNIISANSYVTAQIEDIKATNYLKEYFDKYLQENCSKKTSQINLINP